MHIRYLQGGSPRGQGGPPLLAACACAVSSLCERRTASSADVRIPARRHHHAIATRVQSQRGPPSAKVAVERAWRVPTQAASPAPAAAPGAAAAAAPGSPPAAQGPAALGAAPAAAPATSASAAPEPQVSLARRVLRCRLRRARVARGHPVPATDHLELLQPPRCPAAARAHLGLGGGGLSAPRGHERRRLG